MIQVVGEVPPFVVCLGTNRHLGDIRREMGRTHFEKLIGKHNSRKGWLKLGKMKITHACRIIFTTAQRASTLPYCKRQKMKAKSWRQSEPQALSQDTRDGPAHRPALIRHWSCVVWPACTDSQKELVTWVRMESIWQSFQPTTAVSPTRHCCVFVFLSVLFLNVLHCLELTKSYASNSTILV